MYIERHLAQCINKYSKFFGATIVTGARQVGKTTLLKNCLASASYTTLDDRVLLAAAKNDSATFVENLALPAVIDEIQYAPELFSRLKIKIDESGERGLFFLSGSQQFHLMKNVSESLAGRIAVLNLQALSLREIAGEKFYLPFIPNADFMKARIKQDIYDMSSSELWKLIHRGAMPQLVAESSLPTDMFYAGYVTTYIERDIRALEKISDESKFLCFMTATAARTGQLLNLSDLARDADVSVPTVTRWLSLLETSNLVYLLKPWYSNLTKRIVKTPKLYFLDTGLAAYLTGWSNPEVLQKGAMSGAFFETFVVSEIIKSWYNAGIVQPPIYYYRDKDGAEIDLMIFTNGKLYPVEIKKHAEPRQSDTRHFACVGKLSGVERGEGTVISPYRQILPLGDGNFALPATCI